jgi:hypothetical protein
MAQIPKQTRFLADATVYSPTGRRQITIHVDPSGLDAQGQHPALATGRSYLEFTVTPTTAEIWSANQLRFNEGGACSIIRNMRVLSRQSGVVLDECANWNLLWDALWRSGYDDAERDTLGRMIGAQTSSESRGVFAAQPVTVANFKDVASFTARIPLPLLQGIFKSPSIPLELTKGLTLQIELEDRISAAFTRIAITPPPAPFTPLAITSLLAGANDKSGGATATVLLAAAGPDAVLTARTFGSTPPSTTARVVLWTANAAAISYSQLAYTSINTATPATITFGANAGTNADYIGGFIEFVPPPAAVAQYSLAAANLSAATSTTVTTLEDLDPADSLIKVGDYVAIKLNSASLATPVVVTPVVFSRKVKTITANANKTVYELEVAIGAAPGNLNFNAGGYIELVLSPTGGAAAGNSMYTVTAPSIVAASAPVPSLPKQLSWISWTGWGQQMAAGSSVSLQWPTLPYGRALSALARLYNADPTAVIGLANAVSDYTFLLNGEAAVEGGAVQLPSILNKTEFIDALEAAGIAMKRSTTVNDTLAVALQAPSAAPVDTMSSVISLRVSNVAAAATCMLFIAHLRTLMPSAGSGMPEVSYT